MNPLIDNNSVYNDFFFGIFQSISVMAMTMIRVEMISIFHSTLRVLKQTLVPGSLLICLATFRHC